MKKYSIFTLCFVVCIVANANSWDKFVSVKASTPKETPSNVVIPSTVESKAEPANYKKFVRKTKSSAPVKSVTTPATPLAIPHVEVVQQTEEEPVYQPEIVPPYEVEGTSISASQLTYQQAKNQLLLQQEKAGDAVTENWNMYSNTVNADVGYDKTHSQWFDNDIRPVYYFRGGLIDETLFSGYGATEIAIVDLKARLFKIVDFLPGASLDAWLFADGMYFIDNPGISALPDALLSAGIDLGVWWRFTNGFSWELRGVPGIYSDPTAPAFSCTGTLNLHYTVSENFSLVAGATYRPEWDMEIFPNIGFIWQPSELFRVHAALPESRVDLFPRHIFNFFATFAWDNTTYWLDNDESLPGTVTFDAYRASVGATLTLFNDLEITAEIGTHLKHELKGDVEGEDTIKLDEASFIRASIGNRF